MADVGVAEAAESVSMAAIGNGDVLEQAPAIAAGHGDMSPNFKTPVESLPPKPNWPKPADPKTRTISKVAPDSVKASSGVVPKKVPYDTPEWSGVCEDNYALEVLRSGQILERFELKGKSHVVFGRFPNCDVVLAHPSLSRYHAALQYCEGCEEPRPKEKGWYLYDMGSTHGTVMNKRQVPAEQYIRVHVDYVLKFGGSTRLFIVQGPDLDRLPESSMTATEFKERNAKLKAQLEAKLAKAENDEESRENIIRAVDRSGCGWGMGSAVDNPVERDSSSDEEGGGPGANNPFEKDDKQDVSESDIADPQKALNRWFEREGMGKPDYHHEMVEPGKHACAIELPITDESGVAVKAIIDNAARKRDAMNEVALAAIRLLAENGAWNEAGVVRKRAERDWEANDYYSSDEDSFFDRTGQLERKRKLRKARITGKGEETVVHTYESLKRDLKAAEDEMADIEKKLSADKEKAGGLVDGDLDSYMSALASGAMDASTRMRYKRNLVVLRQQRSKLERLVTLAAPATLPGSKEAKKAAASSLPIYGKRSRVPVSQKKRKIGKKTGSDSSESSDSDPEQLPVQTIKTHSPERSCSIAAELLGDHAPGTALSSSATNNSDEGSRHLASKADAAMNTLDDPHCINSVASATESNGSPSSRQEAANRTQTTESHADGGDLDTLAANKPSDPAPLPPPPVNLDDQSRVKVKMSVGYSLPTAIPQRLIEPVALPDEKEAAVKPKLNLTRLSPERDMVDEDVAADGTRKKRKRVRERDRPAKGGVGAALERERNAAQKSEQTLYDGNDPDFIMWTPPVEATKKAEELARSLGY